MRIIQVLLLWILWSTCIFLTPESTYWRDSGEFIIQAFALDITHPAGFPLYGMLANLFALLPLGPIPWRIILLSGAALVLLICCIALVIREMLSRVSPASILDTTLATALVIVGAATVLPLLLKQVFSAEVYLLNATLLLLVTALALRGTREINFHYLAAAAFIGGLSIGNHISAALVGIIFGTLLLLLSSLARRSAGKLLLFSLTGLLVYAYLPIRASTTLPLNTGQPNSALRFWNVVSDARDRQLRAAPEVDPASPDLGGFEHLLANPLSNLRNDLNKLKLPTSVLALSAIALALAGALALHPAATVLLAGIAIGNYAFFAGWDGDPWIPAVVAFGIIVVCGSLHMVTVLTGGGRTAAPALAAGLLAMTLIVFPAEETIAQLIYLKNYETPARVSEEWLTSSSAPLAITENSWFLARYLADIEGVADEKVILYQPSILFPTHFSPARIVLKDGTLLDSEVDMLTHGTPPNLPSFSTLGHFVDTISRQSTLMIEPGLLVNTALHPVLKINQYGTAEINRGTFQQSHALTAETLIGRFSKIAKESGSAPPFIRSDVRNYFENILNNQIDLLKKQNQEGVAVELLERLCLPIDSGQCSLVSLNHLGLLYLKRGNGTQAAGLYRELMRRSPDAANILERNLALADAQASAPTAGAEQEHQKP